MSKGSSNYGSPVTLKVNYNWVEGVVSKETVVLRRWGVVHKNFGNINGVDNVNWPPYRDSKATSLVSVSSTYLDSRSNESSRRNLAEKSANFAGCRLLYTTLIKWHFDTCINWYTVNLNFKFIQMQSISIFSSFVHPRPFLPFLCLVRAVILVI